jgi:transposase
MRFYTKTHRHYCGIDLHSRKMYLCILDGDGNVLLHRNIVSSPATFLAAIKPFREGLVVGVECMFAWYWLADLCCEEQIEFVLGHALYMRAVHGGKSKTDRIDAYKLAMLLRGGMFPVAYVYPAEMRSTRDLMRRRIYFVRKRSELLAHIQNTVTQYNLPSVGADLGTESNRLLLREQIAECFPDPGVQKMILADLAIIDSYGHTVTELDREIEKTAKEHDCHAILLLRSIRGIGTILSLVMLYEIHDIGRFQTVQQFASYARLVKCAHESAGKKKGTGGAKMGNPHLKWAFSEAAMLFVRHNPSANKLMEHLVKIHGKGKALSIMAHKLGRAIYYMLKNNTPFDRKRFLTTA